MHKPSISFLQRADTIEKASGSAKKSYDLLQRLGGTLETG